MDTVSKIIKTYSNVSNSSEDLQVVPNIPIEENISDASTTSSDESAVSGIESTNASGNKSDDTTSRLRANEPRIVGIVRDNRLFSINVSGPLAYSIIHIFFLFN